MKRILFSPDAIFRQNPEFICTNELNNFAFVHQKSGQKVSTDSLGASIWANLPGTADEIIARISGAAEMESTAAGAPGFTRGSTSAAKARPLTDLMNFIYLLYRAQIIEFKDEASGTKKEAVEVPADPPLISAIIVTRNGEEHIRACLSSLRAQTYPNLEILVVDNGSTDRTRDIIRAEFPTVAVHAPGKNLFYPGGVNFGMERARGDYFLVLNDDTELEPSSMALLFRKMAQDERIAAVVPMMKLFHLRGFINGIGNHVRERSWGSDNFVGCVDIGQFADLGEVPSACVSAVLIRKAAVADIGPLDAEYLAYYEDADWSFRAGLRGWKIVPEPGAIVYHKFSAYWKNMERKLKLAVRNRLRFVLKLFQGKTKRTFLKNYLKEDLKNVVSFLRTRQFKMAMAYPRAYISLAVSLPDIFVKRRAVMKRKAPEGSIENILRKNPENWSCMDAAGVPVVDVAAYRRYYKLEFERMGK